MANEFDSINYRVTEPGAVYAGDRVAWKRVDLGTDYPPADYDLKYDATLEGDGTKKIELTATANGEEFLIEVTSASSEQWTTGIYHWQAYIVRKSDSARITINRGMFEVRPDRATSTADPRTHARIMLDAIEALLEKRATSDQVSYQINGRSLSRIPIPDLMTWRDRYRAQLVTESAAMRVARGRRPGNSIRVRFKS